MSMGMKVKYFYVKDVNEAMCSGTGYTREGCFRRRKTMAQIVQPLAKHRIAVRLRGIINLI